ncbi:type II toxin-antitoxin system RelE/ParE family toxin [Bradyrhizobium sp. HKCCYLS2038]|uniref:type II toxin-antitoxin system RelE/ParE family toxin n=1 Tax=unclassified Bradyrhizobium TaxID=2631580 RepID=UPI003EBE327D
MGVFKTAWFSKAARKARIGDAELCEAIQEVKIGQADDLGGGVFKKRLNKNMYRSIILAKSGRNWIYAYLFAKKDRANIADDELDDFRTLAKSYAALDDAQLAELLMDGDLVEICREKEK